MATQPTKRAQRKKAPSSIDPITVRMLVADEFREEVNGKTIAVGLYPDSVVNVDIPKDVPPIGPDNPIRLMGFSLMLTVMGAQGSKSVSVELGLEPGREPETLMQDEIVFPTQSGRSANIILMLQRFHTFSEGEKPVTVHIGEHTSKLAFEIRRGPGKYVED